MLKQRVLAALVLIPAFLAALFLFPQWAWAALLGVVGLIGSDEWARLSGFNRIGRGIYLGVTALLFYACYEMLAAGPVCGLVSISVIFWIAVAPIWLARHWRGDSTIVRVLLGWVLLIPTWIAMVELRMIAPGLLLFVMGMIWLADSGAYLSGRLWGKHKLAPAISPGKTWEGVAGAVVAVVILAGLVAMWGREFFLNGDTIPATWLIAVCCFMVAVSVYGDLFESHMKRLAGVKDSGTLIPGHGGVLDRIDSQTAALPMFFMLCQLYLDRC